MARMIGAAVNRSKRKGSLPVTVGRLPQTGQGWGRRPDSDVDPCSDGFELADPFPEVGQFYPARRGGKIMISDMAGEFEALIVQPGLPSPEAGNAGQADRE